MHALDTFKYKEHTVNILEDVDPINPREDFDNLGTMVCFHNRYNLGDKDHGHNLEDAIEIERSKDVIALPLYLYDHSGITISTEPFSCPWDSGKVGFIYITKEKARAEYGWKLITKKRRAKLLEYLKAEVETYDQYLTGDVYGFNIEDENGEDYETIWGYFGMDSARDEAKSIIDSRMRKEETNVRSL